MAKEFTGALPKPPKRLPAKPRRLPRESPKRAEISGERRYVVRETLESRPQCEFRVGHLECTNRATDVHEIDPRSHGGPIVPSQGLSPEDVRSLCRECHDWVHANHDASVALGYLVPSWFESAEPAALVGELVARRATP